MIERNENKFMSKVKGFLILVLFTVIYFFFQKTIYPVLGLLFWLVFAMSSGGIILNALEFLNLPQEGYKHCCYCDFRNCFDNGAYACILLRIFVQ